MKKLLYIEFLKFRKNPVTLIGLGLFTLLFSQIILYVDDIFNGAPPPFPNAKVLLEFPTIWDYQGYIGNWLVSVILGFIMVNFITIEETNKTMRQSIINGLTRKEYWLGKIGIVISLSAFATLVYVVSVLIFGTIHTSDWDLDLILDSNYAPLKFFLMSLGYLTMASLFGFWVKRGLLSLFAYFAYIFVFEQIIRGIHLYYFKHRSVIFYPANIIEDLMPNPMFKAPDSFFAKDLGFKFLVSSTESTILTIVLVLLFTWITYRLLKTKDL